MKEFEGVRGGLQLKRQVAGLSGDTPVGKFQMYSVVCCMSYLVVSRRFSFTVVLSI